MRKNNAKPIGSGQFLSVRCQWSHPLPKTQRESKTLKKWNETVCGNRDNNRKMCVFLSRPWTSNEVTCTNFMNILEVLKCSCVWANAFNQFSVEFGVRFIDFKCERFFSCECLCVSELWSISNCEGTSRFELKTNKRIIFELPLEEEEVEKTTERNCSKPKCTT